MRPEESKLPDMLRVAISLEIRASVQYMWQHVRLRGPAVVHLRDMFHAKAIQELEHAEMLAEHADGALRVWKPMPIAVGRTPAEMVERAMMLERRLIAHYIRMEKVAASAGNQELRGLVAWLIDEEKEHLNALKGLEWKVDFGGEV